MRKNTQLMRQNARLAIYIAVSGFFLLLDQFLKFLTIANQDITIWYRTPWFGWELLLNPGIAFSIPFPNALLLTITPLLILGLLWLFIKQKEHALFSFGILLMIAGAISNFIDRVSAGVTIDYIRIFTSVINLADIIIVIGAIIIATSWEKKS